jgi:hypothetical protein
VPNFFLAILFLQSDKLAVFAGYIKEKTAKISIPTVFRLYKIAQKRIRWGSPHLIQNLTNL